MDYHTPFVIVESMDSRVDTDGAFSMGAQVEKDDFFSSIRPSCIPLWVGPTPIADSHIKVVQHVPLSAASFYNDTDMHELLLPLIHPAAGTAKLLSSGIGPIHRPSREAAAVSSPWTGSSCDQSPNDESRFRSYQSKVWWARFQELQVYKNVFGDCMVPHNWPPNKRLAQWVKRQRYQHKLDLDGMSSTMTPKRKALLDGLGFVWDLHGQVWDKRFHEYLHFQQTHGHGNVPSKYPTNPKLSMWVKCQRRQYKLLVQGKPSTLTSERKDMLDAVGFPWNPRNLHRYRHDM